MKRAQLILVAFNLALVIEGSEPVLETSLDVYLNQACFATRSPCGIRNTSGRQGPLSKHGVDGVGRQLDTKCRTA
jgi:hypothetical protein